MSLNTKAKSYLNTLCEAPLMRGLIRRSAVNDVNVIYYHYVGNEVPYYQAFGGGCTVSEFTRDMEYLCRIFDFVPLESILQEQPNNCERPRLAVTFDDGFDLNSKEFMDVINHYNIKITTFVITSCINNQSMMWRHMLSALQSLIPETVWRSRYNELSLINRRFNPIRNGEGLLRASSQWPMNQKDELAAQLWRACNLPNIGDYLAEWQPYFTWSGLREWIAAGHSVGFHTHTHPYCSRIEQADLDREIIAPAEILKQRLNIGKLALSYPFGDRLRPDLEESLFEQGHFSAFFGVNGFSRMGTSHRELQRVGVESGLIGWNICKGHATSRFR